MMSTETACLSVDELERQIKAVEPAALLVPPKLLRRVIKLHRNIGGIGFLVPHRKGYGLPSAALLRYVQPDELAWPANAELPPYIYLLIRPDPERFAKQAPHEALVKHWRILFHLHIDRIMRQKVADGSLSTALVRQRIARLGMTEFAEITEVLRQEDYLLPPEAPEAIYAEFVAVYLTMRCFEPQRLAHFFPALRNLDDVDAMIAEDLDAEAVYKATCLSSPSPPRGRGAGGEGEVAPDVSAPSRQPLSPGGERGLQRVLVDRLKNALELSEANTEQWWHSLSAFPQDEASSTQESLFLADLRNVCFDAENVIYTVDMVEWAMSLGELPIRRPLPGHQDIAMLRHLRSALKRVRYLQLLSDEQRNQLHELMEHTLHEREQRTRERFRPSIANALDEVGLKPANVAEQIGRAKLIEELLDRIVECGHLNIGNLRDAISRNQLKLPDLKSPVELLRGDPLIRLNRRLAVALDGVYRRGEFYMRLLHRLSSIAFGTMLGRLLVLFLILPFGLAFFVMITPEIAMEEGEKLATFVGRLIGMVEPAPPKEPGQREVHHFPLPDWGGVIALGVFFVVLFNVGSFRTHVFHQMGELWQGAHIVFVRWPVRFFSLPLVQRLLHNPIWRLFRRCVLWPGLMAFNGVLFDVWFGLSTPVSVTIAVVSYGIGIILFNTRLIRDVEETATDWLMRYWIWFTIEFIPGLLRLIMDLSRRFLESVEHILYTVNEWLRSSGGENCVMVGIKAVLGLVVFLFAYVIRFAINLLIEPQVNPIKHFPVVTVSHKVCLPLIPTLAGVLDNLGVNRPGTTATGIIFGIPGIFGFMVWELKENWKLYGANRSANLKPVLIGSHGETMLRFLHPGFHSGTIPKLFRRLRRAERHEAVGGSKARKLVEALHHAEESIAHFVERELVALLRQSKSWAGVNVELGLVRLATNRVSIELTCSDLGSEPLVFAFDHRCGWLLAGVLEAGWLPRLHDEQKQTLAAALAGLYKMAGVDATREQIATCLPATTFAFDITAAGLVVWPSVDAGQIVYDLNAGPKLAPLPTADGMPILQANQLLFGNEPLAWQQWVRACEGDAIARPSAQVLGRI